MAETPRDLFRRLREMAATNAIPQDWLRCDLVGDVGGLQQGDVIGVSPAAGHSWAEIEPGAMPPVEQYRNSTVMAIVVYGQRVAILPLLIEAALLDGAPVLDMARLARYGISELTPNPESAENLSDDNNDTGHRRNCSLEDGYRRRSMTKSKYQYRAICLRPLVWYIYGPDERLVAILDDTNATRPHSAYKLERMAYAIASGLTVAEYEGGLE